MYITQLFFDGYSGMDSYLDKRCRPHLQPTNDSWRVDETYIEVKGKQKYLYRAVDSSGNTLDFLLSAKRNALFSRTLFS